jgi:hypothetical protein
MLKKILLTRCTLAGDKIIHVSNYETPQNKEQRHVLPEIIKVIVIKYRDGNWWYVDNETPVFIIENDLLYGNNEGLLAKLNSEIRDYKLGKIER